MRPPIHQTTAGAHRPARRCADWLRATGYELPATS